MLLVADLPASVADTAKLLADQGYIADQELATTVHLALAMRRPLFLEGEPGTGKTEIAKVLAAGLQPPAGAAAMLRRHGPRRRRL